MLPVLRLLPLFAMLALPAVGCATRSGIDPSGQRIFDRNVTATPAAGAVVAPTTVALTSPPDALALPGIALFPGRLVAPIGNEVILVAGAHKAGKPNVPYERVEWMLAPNGVGTFLAVGESDRPFFSHSSIDPRKLDNNYAVSETAAIRRVLTRGTAAPNDDVSILPGQSWITISSPIEGVSYVTAYAPDILGTSGNRQTAIIQWVDARWVLSPSTNGRSGAPTPITVNVYRQSDGKPIPNWRVRYTISGGPPANFTNGGAQSVELPTDPSGTAIAELTQPSPQLGTNLITVELVRPPEGIPGAVEPLVIGTATTQVAWTESGPVPLPSNPGIPIGGPSPGTPAGPSTPGTSAAPLRLTLAGPETGAVGQEVVYNLDIQSLSERELAGLIVRVAFDDGLQFAGGENPVVRRLEPLPAGRKSSIRIPVRPARPGRLCQTVTVVTAEGAQATTQACLNAVAPTGGINDLPKLTLNIVSNKGRALQLDDKPIFTFELANPSNETVRDIQVTAEFDPEFRMTRATQGIANNYDSATRKIVWTLPELKAGAKQTPALLVETELARITQPNRPARIRAIAIVNGQPISQEISVEITPTRAAAPTAGSRAQMSVTPPPGAQFRVGTKYPIVLTIENPGSAPDKNLQISMLLPEQVVVKEADIVGPLRPTINGRVLTFAPLPVLGPTSGSPPPDRPFIITINATVERPGTGELRAKMISEAVPNPPEFTKTIQFN